MDTQRQAQLMLAVISGKFHQIKHTLEVGKEVGIGKVCTHIIP